MSVDVQEASPAVLLDGHSRDVRRTLSVNVEMVRCLLPEFDQVSIAVVDATGEVATLAHAGDLVAELDGLQNRLHEGPVIDSLRIGVPVLAPHIQRSDRWHRYVPTAAQLGLRSQLVAPLVSRDGVPRGVLNLYSTTRGEIMPTVPLIARALAAQAADSLASLTEIENLQRALATRKTIGIAIGLLMERHQLTEKAAFAVLRRRSSYANVKLRDIAAQLVGESDDTGLELRPAAIC